jgi:U3 small nucleolar ribonucleoprotein protein LCP5
LERSRKRKNDDDGGRGGAGAGGDMGREFERRKKRAMRRN